MATVSVIVCAHNEERAIGALLADVLAQECPEGRTMREVLVVADGCTDGTEDIVRAASARDSRVRLLRLEPPNRGKSYAFNRGITSLPDDVVVMFDADVRLADRGVLARLVGAIDAGAALASGNDIPDPAPVRTSGHRASLGRHLIKQELKRAGLPEGNVYTCVGRALAMHRSFFAGLEIPDLPGEDNFRYFTAMSRGMRYAYVHDAVVFFTPALTVSDYMRQHARFWHGAAAMRSLFGPTASYGAASLHWRTVCALALQHPRTMLTWFMVGTGGQLRFLWERYLLGQRPNGIWEIASSTK